MDKFENESIFKKKYLKYKLKYDKLNTKNKLIKGGALFGLGNPGNHGLLEVHRKNLGQLQQQLLHPNINPQLEQHLRNEIERMHELINEINLWIVLAVMSPQDQEAARRKAEQDALEAARRKAEQDAPAATTSRCLTTEQTDVIIKNLKEYKLVDINNLLST